MRTINDGFHTCLTGGNHLKIVGVSGLLQEIQFGLSFLKKSFRVNMQDDDDEDEDSDGHGNDAAAAH